MTQHEFRLPDLGEGLESADIVTWLVAVGDRVEIDQPLLEVETAKANVELPSPLVGVVVTLHGDPGTTVAVGAPLVTIAVDAAADATVDDPPDTRHAPDEPERPLVGYGEAPSPRARARRRGPGTARTVAVRGVRKVVADRMTRSHREVPDASTWTDADATELVALRDSLRTVHPDAKITPLVLLLRVCVAALLRFPILNSRLDDSGTRIELYDEIHLGVATQTERGLLVPVVRDAHRRTTLELAAEMERLVDGARAATLTPQELTGSTFTVSNYGSFGTDGGVAIINHPEVAILGVGRIAPRPWVLDGALAVRDVVQLSLSFDHRVCDGADAGGFLRLVADGVERPATLFATL